MNSVREAAHDGKIDPILKELVSEAAANLRDRHRSQVLGACIGEPLNDAPLPKRIFDGPTYDGKQCAVCKRHFKSSAEYVTCRLCKASVCRRRGDCKNVHHAEHRIAAKKAQTGGAA